MHVSLFQHKEGNVCALSIPRKRHYRLVESKSHPSKPIMQQQEFLMRRSTESRPYHPLVRCKANLATIQHLCHLVCDFQTPPRRPYCLDNVATLPGDFRIGILIVANPYGHIITT